MAFLEQLCGDLVKDKSYYIERIDNLNNSTAQFELYVPKSYQIQKDRAQFVNLMKPLKWSSDIFTTENSTFEELRNTGQLGIFRNDSIKDAFLSLYKEQERVNKHISQLNDLSRVEFYKFSPFLVKYTLLDNIFNQSYMFHEIEWEFINDPTSARFRLIESTVATYIFKHRIFKRHFENLLLQTRSLMKLVDEEVRERR